MSDSIGTGKLEMRVGILVVSGLAMTVILILLSDKISFEGRYRVTVYLDDSSGLNPGSPVKRDGLVIGEVDSIVGHRDPQGRGSIRCVALIDAVQEIDATAVLERRTSGIFGDGYLAFANPAKPSGNNLPTDGSAEVVAKGSFLDSATARLERIAESIEELLGPASRDRIAKAVDGAGVLLDETTVLMRSLNQRSAELGQTTTEATALLRELRQTRSDLEPGMRATLDEAAATLAALRQQATGLGAQVEHVAGAAGGTLASADRLLRRSDELLAERQDDLSALIGELRGLAENLRGISADLHQGRGVLGRLIGDERWGKDVDAMLVTGSQLVERVADQPQMLVWGTTPKEADLARDHREREKLRRAFFEGFERNPPLKLPTPQTTP